MTCPKRYPSPAPGESLLYWFQGNCAAFFVLNYWLGEFILPAIANRFELRCEPKQLMLLYYKICPCYWEAVQVKVLCVKCYFLILSTESIERNFALLSLISKRAFWIPSLFSELQLVLNFC